MSGKVNIGAIGTTYNRGHVPLLGMACHTGERLYYAAIRSQTKGKAPHKNGRGWSIHSCLYPVIKG